MVLYLKGFFYLNYFILFYFILFYFDLFIYLFFADLLLMTYQMKELLMKKEEKLRGQH